jgi:hypothetical protein
MSYKKIIFFFFLFLCFIYPVMAGDSVFSLKLTPSFTIPLGEDFTYFNVGGGADIYGEYKLPFFPLVVINLGGGYHYISLQNESKVFLSTASVETGAGVNWEFMKNMSLGFSAGGGYAYCFLNDSEGSAAGYPFISTKLDFSYRLIPPLSVGIGTHYKLY